MVLHVGPSSLLVGLRVCQAQAMTIRESCVAANRHPGQVGYSHSPPQEVRDEESSLRADTSEESEGQASAATSARPAGFLEYRGRSITSGKNAMRSTG